MPTISGGFETGMEGWGAGDYGGSGGTRTTANARSGSYALFLSAGSGPTQAYTRYNLPDASNANISASVWMRGAVQSYDNGTVRLQIRSGTSVLNQHSLQSINGYQLLSVSFSTTGQSNINIYVDAIGPDYCYFDDYTISYEATTNTSAKNGGIWKPATKFENNGGIWKPATTSVKNAGAWKQV